MLKDDIFLKIINKEIKSDLIYQDKYVTVFNDINPKVPFHILIVPNIYIKNMNDVKNNHLIILGKLLLTASKIAKLKKIDKSGYRIIINCNEHGGQKINHLHLHLLGGCYLGKMLTI